VQEEIEDRYGEIPTSVQNLMDISCIKAACAKAHIQSLTIRDDYAKMQFHPQADLEGGKLFAVISQTPNLQILTGEQMMLLLKRPGSDTARIMRELLPILTAVSECVNIDSGPESA